jgi:hypothetical protein
MKKADFFSSGLSAFADISYLEANIGFAATRTSAPDTLDTTKNYIRLGFLAKYPLYLLRKLSLFPAAGFDYQIFTKATRGGNTVKRAELPDSGADKNTADYGRGSARTLCLPTRYSYADIFYTVFS